MKSFMDLLFGFTGVPAPPPTNQQVRSLHQACGDNGVPVHGKPRNIRPSPPLGYTTNNDIKDPIPPTGGTGEVSSAISSEERLRNVEKEIDKLKDEKDRSSKKIKMSPRAYLSYLNDERRRGTDIKDYFELDIG